MGTFEHDTAVTTAPDSGPGAFTCEIDSSWWVVAGPNGGYVAAIAVRAIEAQFGADRPLRSVTMHYLRAPQADRNGEVEADREGGSVTFARVRMLQDGAPFATGMTVLAKGRPSFELNDATPPEVAAAASIEPPVVPEGAAPPFVDHFEFRPAIEAPQGRADVGGWLRLREDRPLDQPLVTALTGSWFPAVFGLEGGPMMVPTLDLTVHLRAPLPRPGDWVLGRYRTRVIGDGFLEEDAELFAADGTLLAQSRQLALAR